MNYVIVTPCKNEEKNLQSLADSIINQTLKPKLWLIIDDGSTDNTPIILNNLINNHGWICVITGIRSQRDLSFHYAEIVSIAIKETYQICNKQNIIFDYIGLIDADMILSQNFFEKIVYKFEKNPNLGVASGSDATRKGNIIIIEKDRDNLPNGGLRVWRRKCYEDTGGFPRSYSADAVSNVLAILHGWETRKFVDIICIQTRKTSSSEGLWKGFKTRGESDYYRDYHPFYVFFKFIKYVISHPYYTGIAYIYSYIYCVLKSKEKIELIEVRKYYRKKHKEIIRYYGKKFKSRL
ncbi:MAG: glycosyltransferase family 2 protein [Candidatus Methanoperedens sp.]|nr:glycosyltransferase family 2 protein [Candidatus Methanoperedens sp.]